MSSRAKDVGKHSFARNFFGESNKLAGTFLLVFFLVEMNPTGT